MEIKNRLQIQLEEGQKIFFTSDLHFGHRNVLKFCNRPWANENDMAKGLIENWNSVVSDKDIIFSLGDFSWWNSNIEIRKILSKLNGQKIYLIPGNHDRDKGYRSLPDRVELLGGAVQVWITGLVPGKPNKTTELFLSHYPTMTWPHRWNGIIQLFGHIHSGINVATEEDRDLPLWPGQQYDVGVDNNNYTPIEIHDIYTKLDRKFE